MRLFNINNIDFIAINNVYRHIQFAETTVANMFLKRRISNKLRQMRVSLETVSAFTSLDKKITYILNNKN